MGRYEDAFEGDPPPSDEDRSSAEHPALSDANRRREPRILSANLLNYRELAERLPGMPSSRELYASLGLARTIDISPGGCRIRSRDPLPVGAKLTLDLKLADQIVTCQGMVCHLTEREGEFEAGIAFEDLDELAEDGIRLYLHLKEDAIEAP